MSCGPRAVHLPEKQMACFTLPKKIEKPGYQIRCKSPKCFFITPCGWALVAGTYRSAVTLPAKVTPLPRLRLAAVSV